MTLTLDAATEQSIQREIDLGHYANPAAVVAHAVALLVGETQTERSGRRLGEILDEGGNNPPIPGDELEP